MEITAKIKQISYTALCGKTLPIVDLSNLDFALDHYGSFLLRLDEVNYIAVSFWVSPKRTRSYPLSRVYDTYTFSGKRVTIIPFYKDEGFDGERDYIQWDTISMMSLLQVYVIIGYYSRASRNTRYDNKITKQKFDISFIRDKISELKNFHSDALHWNLSQVDNITEIGNLALKSYREISQNTQTRLHSFNFAEGRINEISRGAEEFKIMSRNLAKNAQHRESLTVQIRERLTEGDKSIITIENLIGGKYYLTADEARISDNQIYIVEGKHTSRSNLPSLADIKEGLVKMVLYTNLDTVTVAGEKYDHRPMLKLTSDLSNPLSRSKLRIVELLEKEAITNKFELSIGRP